MGLLGVVIAKKRSGKSDDEIKDDLKRSVCRVALRSCGAPASCIARVELIVLHWPRTLW